MVGNDSFLERVRGTRQFSAEDAADLIGLKEALEQYNAFNWCEQTMVEALVEADGMSFIEAVDQVEEENPACLILDSSDWLSDDGAYESLGSYLVEDLDLFCDQLTRPRELRGMWIGDFLDYEKIGRYLCECGDISEYEAIDGDKVFYWSHY